MHGLLRDAGVARSASQSRSNAGQVGLRGQAAQAAHGAIYRIAASLNGGQHRSGGNARSVVRMEVHGQAGFFLQGLDQRGRRARPAYARHVLDAQHMRASGLELFGNAHVVFQVVLGACAVEQVGGVADRAFAQGASLYDGVHRHAHVFDPVERVKYTKQVDAAIGCLLHEVAHDVVGVVGVAHGVGAAQQHLQQHVRDAGAQVGQAFPGVFLEEAQGHVERGATPAFQREQLAQLLRVKRRDRQHVGRAHARGKKRLVRIAHRGVGEQHLGLFQHPLGKALGPQFAQPVACAGRYRGSAVRSGQNRPWQGQCWQGPAFHFRVAVHAYVGQIAQQAGGAVAPFDGADQVRVFVDETGGQISVGEGRMGDEVFKKLQVRGHAADAEFAQGALHAVDRFLGRWRPGGDLDQQRVVIRRDDGTAVGRAGVEPHAKARRAAVGAEAAIVWQEVVGRVFGGDAALQGMAAEADISLRRYARSPLPQPPLGVVFVFEQADVAAFGDADLRLHDIDSGHLFGDGVFDLDAGVDLHEVELPAVHVHQEFHRAGVAVAHGLHEPERFVAQGVALLAVQVGRRRAFHHLLVAPLYGAVALEQVHRTAVQIAQDLHFHMAGPAHEFFKIQFVIAEGGLGFAPGGFQRSGQIGIVFDHAHAPAAAAPRGLEHDRVANFVRQRAATLHVARQGRGSRHHRHAGRHCGVTRRHLVAQRAHHVGPGTDPQHAGIGHGLRKIGIFSQKAVTGMNGVHPCFPGDAQNVLYVEVGL